MRKNVFVCLLALVLSFLIAGCGSVSVGTNMPDPDKIVPQKDTLIENLEDSGYKIENGYVATGKIETNKYVHLSDSLKIIGCFGDYRPKANRAAPNVLHRQANYGKTELSLDKKKLVEIIYNS